LPPPSIPLRFAIADELEVLVAVPQAAGVAFAL